MPLKLFIAAILIDNKLINVNSIINYHLLFMNDINNSIICVIVCSYQSIQLNYKCAIRSIIKYKIRLSVSPCLRFLTTLILTQLT